MKKVLVIDSGVAKHPRLKDVKICTTGFIGHIILKTGNASLYRKKDISQFRIFHILPSFRYSTFRSLLYRTNCTIEGRKSLQRNYYNIFIRHLRQIITYV